MCSKHVQVDVFLENCVKELLNDLFVQSYGESFISYNVHSLIHLLSDFFRFRDVYSFSVFRFENFLQFLKRAIRSLYQPLTQAVNRVKENGLFLGRLGHVQKFGKLSKSYYCDNEKRYKIFSNEVMTLKARSKDGFVRATNER